MVIKRRHETRIVVWPHYFDSRVGRREGRRVPRSAARKKPSLEVIAFAAETANLKFEMDPHTSHPFFWWEKSGRLLVVSDDPKTKVIKDISLHIPEPEEKTEEQEKK